MDCTAARELLDVSARRAGDDADLAQALEHVRSCPSCANVVRSHERFDDAVGLAMRDVAVPGGLKDRLLAAVGAATTVAPPVVAPSKRRSRWIVRVAASAAAIAMAVGVWQLVKWQRRPQPFDLAQLQAFIDQFRDSKTGQLSLSQFEKFDDSFDVAALTKWLGTSDLKGVNIDRRGGHDGVVTLIQLSRNPQSVAVLLMIPAARLKDADALASPANVSYSPLAHVVMRDGGYVCVYCTTANNLDDLKRLARGLAA